MNKTVDLGHKQASRKIIGGPRSGSQIRKVEKVSGIVGKQRITDASLEQLETIFPMKGEEAFQRFKT